MGDDNAVYPSKKRAAGEKISRDNPGLDDKEDVSELEAGTFKKASDDVLASRRIVKVCRQQTLSTTSAQCLNPFADICLVLPTTSETKDGMQADTADKANSAADAKAQTNDEKVGEHTLSEGDSEVKIDVFSADQKKLNNVEKATQETTLEKKQANGGAEEEVKDASADAKVPETGDENKNKDLNVMNDDEGADATLFHSFQQLSSSKNAFSGLSGSGFSSSSFSFGSFSKDGSPSVPSFSFGTCKNGSTSLFGAAGVSGNKSEGPAFPSMQEVPAQTGEENEYTISTADSALFEFFDGAWKERGKGQVKLNLSTIANKKPRLVMRAQGNYRLILNASLYPDMKLTRMEKKGITFVCVNSITEGNASLATFALKFKDTSLVETFSAAVELHKGK